ncbi:MAG: SMC family ATPase [Anaerolineae bacterium]|nr:SMC family ATPase [Anaerolineae bacterium]MCX8066845.1 SMC family ATPase [Anaerolineae bacterium]
MIPQRLRLTNFMPYRQAELDFTGIHVACLSGENGAGKSALLDAMTWALWGKARARRDDDLIRQGAEEMEVDFTFRLGDDLYRVIRRRRSGKRGSSLLDLQIHDNGRWRSLAESSIRTTEEKITRLLHLDYETFINSAFLRQGRADEFTIKTPAERKRVLSDILGLDIWQEYEERAKARLETIRAEFRLNDLRLEEIERELARRPEYEAQVEEAQREAERWEAELRRLRAAWEELERLRGEYRRVQEQQAEAASRVAQAQRELDALDRERREREARLEAYRALLEQAEEIEQGYAAYQVALRQEQALSEKLSALAELRERRSALEAEIARARHSLELHQEGLVRQIQMLRSRLVTPDLLQRHQILQTEIAWLNELRQQHEALRETLGQMALEATELQTRNQVLKEEMEVLKEQMAMLEGAGAVCPLCRRPLSEHDRVRLLEEIQREGREKGNIYRANAARLKDLAAELKRLQEQARANEARLESLPRLEREAATLAERLRESDEAARQLEAFQAEYDRLAATLAAEDYAHEARAALEEIRAQETALGYDAAAHEEARRAVRELGIYAERREQLTEARTGVEREERELARLEETRRRWEEQLAAEQARYGELEERARALKARLVEAPALEAELRRVEEEKFQADQRLGAARQRLAACDNLAREKENRLRQRAQLAHRASLYEELCTAFGIKGIPAMIIEAVIPEIEAEANHLLARMTAGRMHVRLETQREILSGEVRETLDIHIADELGERPYEMYSGGEQFRINFALRIALSRLLTRRAGAQLQTLFIDEGFGSQDPQGRERLVEAIHSIQDEFACILVITHLEDLRDAFPARIEVTKTPQGSVVNIL